MSRPQKAGQRLQVQGEMHLFHGGGLSANQTEPPAVVFDNVPGAMVRQLPTSSVRRHLYPLGFCQGAGTLRDRRFARICGGEKISCSTKRAKDPQQSAGGANPMHCLCVHLPLLALAELEARRHRWPNGWSSLPWIPKQAPAPGQRRSFSLPPLGPAPGQLRSRPLPVPRPLDTETDGRSCPAPRQPLRGCSFVQPAMLVLRTRLPIPLITLPRLPLPNGDLTNW